jgi:hypothetical protein
MPTFEFLKGIQERVVSNPVKTAASMLLNCFTPGAP